MDGLCFSTPFSVSVTGPSAVHVGQVGLICFHQINPKAMETWLKNESCKEKLPREDSVNNANRSKQQENGSLSIDTSFAYLMPTSTKRLPNEAF